MRALFAFLVISATLLIGTPARADSGPGIIHRILTYVPNRALDVLDLVRLRARVGPGLAAGVRVTDLADVYAGSYWSVYAGLPGPRRRRLPRLPAGIETHHGIEVSAVDAATGAGFGPDYSPSEIGAGAQLFLVGFDFGLDPVEVFDLIAGFVFLDPRGDDL